ncbi:MAG TPA: Re/Si-specific NAD(P)(+) transhydrogenase subunit alpha [Capsulimonadaceae bacterium]|jgi:NAD(P) transhydrogenase subunit alpha
MIVAVPQERNTGERRVALIPDGITRLIKSGLTVRVQSGAGVSAGFLDEAYAAAGAEIAPDTASLYKGADIVVKVARPDADELAAIPSGAIVVGLLSPLGHPDYVKSLADHKLTAISMEMVPRITRAQSMDVLSSQSNLAGYKSVLIAANHLPKILPMMTTAAGTIPPAKVLILGVGVAGLQAIATARRLGAVVSAFDVRAVVKEQVHSLGAEFIEINVTGDGEAAGGYARALTPEEAQKQREMMIPYVAASDIVITTALVPGRPAPLMVIADAVKAMKPGSVIIDMAAETGGNCELTVKGEVVSVHGVTIDGTLNLPATVPFHASQLYSRNITSLLALIVNKEGALNLDFKDEIIASSTLTHDGEVLHKVTRAALGLPEGEGK